ncbi:MAG: TonB-dependent receptor plug domain-containing protein [Cryomorphaceae bacterium]|nr:TonB-dependent receptor plug domain-containing protein [Cryomorphaceae bacterium]
MNKRLLLWFLLLSSLSICGQNQVKFQVINAFDGEGLGFCRVLTQGKTLITDNYGYFSISFSASDSVKICLSHVNLADTCLTISQNTIIRPIHIIQVKAGTELGSVDVVSVKRMVEVQNNRVQIGEELIQKTPTIFGEKDIFRSLQLMPQVTMGSEFSSDIHVRGADLGHTLVMVDGIPLFNLSHFYGLFAAINPSVVKSADLYPGVAPAKYNGRVGGFLDVSLKEGNMNEFHGELGVGLIMSKIRLEGPLVKGKSSFHFSARRSYVDMLAKPFMNNDDFITSNMADYMFKYQHRLSKKNLLIISSYFNRDVAYSSLASGASSDGKAENIWGNSTASIRWLHTLNASTQITTKLYFSRYDYKIFEDFPQEDFGSNEIYNFITEFDNAFENFGIGVDGQTWKGKHQLTYGFALAQNRLLMPYVFRKAVNENTGEENIFINNKIGNRILSEYTAYMEDKYHISDVLSLSVGVNLMHYPEIRNTQNTFLMPRTTVDYSPNKKLNIFAGWGMSNQALHHIRFSRIQMPADMWVNAGGDLPVSVSKMYNVGTRYNVNTKWQIGIEGYYRPIDNVVVRREGLSMFLSTDEPEESLFRAVAETYGLEFFTSFSFGVFNGMVSYALMNSTRQTDSLNMGLPFPQDFLRQHNLSVYLTARVNKRFNINSGFTYGSGLPYQIAFQKIPVHPSLFNLRSPQSIDYISQKNGYQMPDFHVLSIGFDWSKKRKKITHQFNVDLYNVYFRANPFYIDYTRGFLQDDSYKLQMFSSFLFVPSFSYTLKF